MQRGLFILNDTLANSTLATINSHAPLFLARRILHDGKCQNGGNSKTMHYKPGVSMPGHMYADSQREIVDNGLDSRVSPR